MREELIFNNLVNNLGIAATSDQSEALRRIALFITENTNDVIFLLTGYAGTGKTSLISAVVRTLDSIRMKSVLLAPTGRAAKVLSGFAGKQAFTVHKKIYRQKSARDGMGNFVLDRNLQKETFFIVDESSMISNQQNDASIFGSGQLLDDLVEYVYSGLNCKLMIVGDIAQLPPVGSVLSPALDESVLRGYGFGIKSAELKEVVRQSKKSGVLVNATAVRHQIEDGEISRPQLICNKFSDIERIAGENIIEEISASYGTCGVEGTIIVVNSNKQANKYNQGIRNRIFFREEEISSGDLVMVVKNNYSLIREEQGPGFVANGDIAEIKKIRKYEERFGFRFAEMQLRFTDYDYEVESKVLLDVLHLDSPSLPAERQRELFNSIIEDYSHVKSRKKQIEAVREDPYFNALQIKFSYAVTCHKAQGGQWERVFIDQGMFNAQETTIDYLRWLYTALTRATGKLFLVNFRDDFFRGD